MGWVRENLWTRQFALLSAGFALFWVVIGLIFEDDATEAVVGFAMLPGIIFAWTMMSVLFKDTDWWTLHVIIAGIANGLFYAVLTQVIVSRTRAGRVETAPQPELGLHRGPSMHRIAPIMGFGGALFTVASMLIFLTLPQVRWFFGASLLAGGLVGLGLWWKHR